VCASVVAIVIALQWGITASFWTGVACYVAAGLGLAEFARRAPATRVAVRDTEHAWPGAAARDPASR
jgi:hypothetical protein